MKKLLTTLLAMGCFLPAFSQQPDLSLVPGTVIVHSPAASGLYIGSPSMAILPGGEYVASHDFFGPASDKNVKGETRIYLSADKGKNWKQIGLIRGQFWSKLFVHGGDLYIIGTNKNYGDIVIRKSTDRGVNWTEPVDGKSGFLKAGEYHCSTTPVIEHNGRLWRAMEDAMGPPRKWGQRFSSFMMSIPVTGDLLNAAEWTSSSLARYDSTYLDGHFTGWLEGNAVTSPDGEMLIALRVDDKTTLEEKMALVEISGDGKEAVFDPGNGFVPFSGGSKKFNILYDPVSRRYWTITNHIPEQVGRRHPDENPARLRNTLALFSSKDLRKWEFRGQLLHGADPSVDGFQYVDFLFDGADLVFVSRTACKDGMGGSANFHDANFLTFHRVTDFRERAR